MFRFIPAATFIICMLGVSLLGYLANAYVTTGIGLHPLIAIFGTVLFMSLGFASILLYYFREDDEDNQTLVFPPIREQ